VSLSTETAQVVVARYGELWLKGKNRGMFERRLERNVRQALDPLTTYRLERAPGQLVVVPDSRPGDVMRRLCEVFGFSSVSIARTADADPEAIAEVAGEVLERALEERPRGTTIPFRVDARRADKSFPLISTELNCFVADRVMPAHEERLRVDLTNPELTLGIHVRPERVYVYAERVPGAGGLPVGTLGRVACLLSGGIDSPVAAWMAMKRGCEVVFVAFHSYPYVGATYLAKIRRLVRRLTRFQHRSVLYEVPFADVQAAIRDGGPPSYRTVLYRRMMQRIATELAGREKAAALVTGESLGQVASQTLENLTCIGAASGLPVLRPLVAFDKTETIERARRIGTFDLSIEPEPDCCTVFQPRKPIIRANPAVCAEVESALDVAALVAAAVAGSERRVFDEAEREG
jgi:thiamine biosynthesis protein ThiI